MSSTCLEHKGSQPGTFLSQDPPCRLAGIVVRGEGARYEADHVTSAVFFVHFFAFCLSDPDTINVLFEPTLNLTP